MIAMAMINTKELIQSLTISQFTVNIMTNANIYLILAYQHMITHLVAFYLHIFLIHSRHKR